MDRRKRLIVLCAMLAFNPHALAQWGGAASGLGEAMQNWAQQMQYEAQQRALMQQQHELEMQRIERSHQLRQTEEERQETARRRDAGERNNDARVTEMRAMEAAHPGWVAIVNSAHFQSWREKQPASVQRLAKSSQAKDAILMLDLYKRDSNNR